MDPNTLHNLECKKRDFQLVLNKKDKLCVKVVLRLLDNNVEKNNKFTSALKILHTIQICNKGII